MFMELREIEIGDNWFNKNSENVVVVDDVYLEKGVVQVDYTYLDAEDESLKDGNPYGTGDLAYFMEEYERLPYNIKGGYKYESK